MISVNYYLNPLFTITNTSVYKNLLTLPLLTACWKSSYRFNFQSYFWI